MDEIEERQRSIALELAVKLAHNHPHTDASITNRAREFYGFLSGADTPKIPTGTYSVTISESPDAS
jgi:hypothetical protein